MALTLTGNTGKVHVLEEIRKLLVKAKKPLNILDVGVVGPSPLEFWQTILSKKTLASKLRLTGVDVRGLDRAEAVAKRNRWNVRLLKSSGYELTKHFEKNSFDVIVSTQVFEHVKNHRLFLSQLKTVLKRGGIAMITFDSGHFNEGFSFAALAARILSTIGIERYRDVGVTDAKTETILKELGWMVMDKRFYNIHPLKEIHNSKISTRLKDSFMARWKHLEDFLNTDKPFIKANKHYFAVLYYKLGKP